MQRIAVVTGASSGIGAATSVRLAEAGYHVVLAARRIDRIEALAAKIQGNGGQAEARQLDVTDRPAVDALADSLERCDVLVCNAGGAMGADPVAEASPDDWLAMYEVNVLGTLHITQALLPKLIDSGDGTIVVMSSTASEVGLDRHACYSASKAGNAAVARCAAVELGGKGIRVNSIHPGGIDTAMSNSPDFDAIDKDKWYASLPISRIGQPGDVAQTALFLASEASSYVTGAQFVVDGGQLAGPSVF